MPRNDINLNVSSEGEDFFEGSASQESVLYYLNQIDIKESGFYAQDLVMEDAQFLPDTLHMLDEHGFFVPEQGTLFVLPIKQQVIFISTIFELLLNIMPQFFDSEITKENIKELFDYTKEHNEKAHEFLIVQPLGAIKQFLTLEKSP